MKSFRIPILISLFVSSFALLFLFMMTLNQANAAPAQQTGVDAEQPEAKNAVQIVPDLDDDMKAEAEKASSAEHMAPQRQSSIQTNSNLVDGAPLFVGVDDVTVNAFSIDVTTNAVYPAFVGVEVWAAAYDPDNDRVLFSDGTGLYEWPIDGAVTFLGTVSDTTGTTSLWKGWPIFAVLCMLPKLAPPVKERGFIR
jgi:hypothetical protein